MFPVVLFPLFGILEAGFIYSLLILCSISLDEVAEAYFNDTQFLFLGSFVVAMAMERWNLHRRIALRYDNTHLSITNSQIAFTSRTTSKASYVRFYAYYRFSKHVDV